jgi:hypothetical protein
MNDGVFSVVRDVPQEVPVQHFSPRNSRKFRGRRVFPDRPHALRVKFINKLAGYTPDEKIVYDDGYDEESATLFEELQLLGVTSPAQAWAEGRYHLVSLRLRPDLWEISTDVEHLVCRRGDLVRVSHDVVSVGLGWGRISAVTADEDGTVTAFELDALVKMVDGTDYGVMIRLPDNRSISRQVVTEAGETQALTLSTSIPGADAPDVGDLVLFGELGSETVDMLVKSIVKVDRDLNATLELVAQAPDIYSADEGDEGTEPPTSMAGLEILVTVFDSPGAFGWNPAANSRIATFELWGGGEPGDEGAGGDGGDGGGGGGYVRFSVSNPSGITGVVGGEDADTTISELSLSAGKGSLGGLATGGDININGGLGDFKVGAVGGHGGDAPQGGSGGRGGVGASVGTAGVIPGGGGGGGSSSAAAGDGAVGMVVVTEYILP